MCRPTGIGSLMTFRSSITSQALFVHTDVVCLILRPLASYVHSTRCQDASGASAQVSTFTNRFSASQVNTQRPSLVIFPSASWSKLSSVWGTKTLVLMPVTPLVARLTLCHTDTAAFAGVTTDGGVVCFAMDDVAHLVGVVGVINREGGLFRGLFLRHRLQPTRKSSCSEELTRLTQGSLNGFTLVGSCLTKPAGVIYRQIVHGHSRNLLCALSWYILGASPYYTCIIAK